MNYPMSLATDSSRSAFPHHSGHQWVVIVFNLLPFFGGQFAPLFHDTMAAALKAYASNLGPKHLAQGLLVTEADLSAGLLHGHLLAYCRRRWLLLSGRWETDEEVARRIFNEVINVATPLCFIWNSGTWKACTTHREVYMYINYLVKQSRGGQLEVEPAPGPLAMAGSSSGSATIVGGFQPPPSPLKTSSGA